MAPVRNRLENVVEGVEVLHKTLKQFPKLKLSLHILKIGLQSIENYSQKFEKKNWTAWEWWGNFVNIF